ncbi:MAG: hypothetical protein Q4C47_03645, partial [Planctomycetia bacterium]|nr:hypothetical protein [Planctomycetia bacterium]
ISHRRKSNDHFGCRCRDVLVSAITPLQVARSGGRCASDLHLRSLRSKIRHRPSLMVVKIGTMESR